MSFALELAALVEKTKGDLDKAVRQAVVLTAQSLVLKSPVDTGRFRANWNLGVGTMDVATSEATDKAGAAVVARVAAMMAEQKAGQVFYITNSLPYAKPLEYGHSKQAPAGMVRLTFAELPGMINRYTAGLK